MKNENNKQYCVYLTIYYGLNLPPFYIGSKDLESINLGYRGSVSSKKWKMKWKEELKLFPELFETHILSYHETREDAFLEEEKIQRKYDVVKSELFANMAYANKKFWHGQKHSKESIHLMKLSQQRFFDKVDKKEWFKKIAEKAKITKRKNWENPTTRAIISKNIANGQNNRPEQKKREHAYKISQGIYNRTPEQKERIRKLLSESSIERWSLLSRSERSGRMAMLIHKNLPIETQIRKIHRWKEKMSSRTEEEKAETFKKWKIANDLKHDERIAKMKETVKNRTEEEKLRVSEILSKSLKGKSRPIFKCPICECSGDIATMKRWGHGENCVRDASKFRGKIKT